MTASPRGSILQRRTPSSPNLYSLKGEGENSGKLDVFGGCAAKHIQFADPLIGIE
jgi:hypothetical protein